MLDSPDKCPTNLKDSENDWVKFFCSHKMQQHNARINRARAKGTQDYGTI
jgi:hypothetical protein